MANMLICRCAVSSIQVNSVVCLGEIGTELGDSDWFQSDPLKLDSYFKIASHCKNSSASRSHMKDKPRPEENEESIEKQHAPGGFRTGYVDYILLHGNKTLPFFFKSRFEDKLSSSEAESIVFSGNSHAGEFTVSTTQFQSDEVVRGNRLVSCLLVIG
ncbi:hypothetical protein CEXT_346371 [Caerostris extrusa]|uniref:Uncharacterized protein n=1 Tax=Caerostris extrusa TaxID=172846 RepID=A0AAV4Q6A3_CAEEX|nr:hypothetical protein CEXT_346371 [Caerostris extrusa]